MSREIKFRAWDTFENKFFEPVYEAYKGKLFDLSLSISRRLMLRTIEGGIQDESIFVGRFLVSQFTGLKDKNGKDIYEGDIVKFHYFYQSFGENMGAQESEHELTGIVQWQIYGYGLNAIKGEHWRGYTGYDDGEGNSDFLLLASMSESSIHEESFEIIGNIHENPELLK